LPASVTAQTFVNTTMTNLPLDIKADKILYVTIDSDSTIPAEKIQIVKNALMSTHSFTKDGKKFYEGWQGALDGSKHNTRYHMPENLKIVDSADNHIKVTITLTTSKSDLGYDGYTYFTQYHKMIKNAHIVVYQADTLTNEDLGAIVRHEFGHALGLGHSSFPSDLMYQNIDGKLAFISDGNVDALSALYDGKILSQYSEVG
jgi:matrixin